MGSKVSTKVQTWVKKGSNPHFYSTSDLNCHWQHPILNRLSVEMQCFCKEGPEPWLFITSYTVFQPSWVESPNWRGSLRDNTIRGNRAHGSERKRSPSSSQKPSQRPAQRPQNLSESIWAVAPIPVAPFILLRSEFATRAFFGNSESRQVNKDKAHEEGLCIHPPTS